MKLLTQVLLCAIISSVMMRIYWRKNIFVLFIIHMALYGLWIFVSAFHQAWNVKLATHAEIEKYNKLVESFMDAK